MNKYRIEVAGATIIATGLGDFDALFETGLFGDGAKIEQIRYFTDQDGLQCWAYSVPVSGRPQIALVTKVSGGGNEKEG